MTLQIEFNPNWSVGDIIRIGDGKTYKITKKTRTCIAATPYYFWNRWLDDLGRWLNRLVKNEPID